MEARGLHGARGSMGAQGPLGALGPHESPGIPVGPEVSWRPGVPWGPRVPEHSRGLRHPMELIAYYQSGPVMLEDPATSKGPGKIGAQESLVAWKLLGPQ
jgi:hypothetical protein